MSFCVSAILAVIIAVVAPINVIKILVKSCTTIAVVIFLGGGTYQDYLFDFKPLYC